jgi:hypothetical protein
MKYCCSNKKAKRAGPKANTAIAIRAELVGIGSPIGDVIVSSHRCTYSNFSNARDVNTTICRYD